MNKSIIGDLFPEEVSSMELFDDVAEQLFPAEVEHIARAVPKRVAEFTTVRACARLALEGLGASRPAQVPGCHGEPTWPEGIVGSMTHCAGYRAAAVARDAEFFALGIDAEPNLALSQTVSRSVLSASEQEHARFLSSARPQVSWERLMFSIKETTFKVWYPLTHRWLGFEDAEVTIQPSGTFVAQLSPSVTPPPALAGGVTGRWACHDGHLVTAAAVRLHGQTAVDPDHGSGDVFAVGAG